MPSERFRPLKVPSAAGRVEPPAKASEAITSKRRRVRFIFCDPCAFVFMRWLSAVAECGGGQVGRRITGRPRDCNLSWGPGAG